MAVCSNGGVVVESGSEKGMFSSLSVSPSCYHAYTHIINPLFPLMAMKRMQHHENEPLLA